jgi:thiamine pyrophosphate-dependent acetolactate synthase large subunit-like protein
MEPIGVYIITSWPGATNIIVMLVDALLDSASMVAIKG